MKLSLHFNRIHARVCRRLWSDIPVRTREIIANDILHESQEYQWFNSKVMTDAIRLWEDPAYYDNSDFSFRVSRTEHA